MEDSLILAIDIGQNGGLVQIGNGRIMTWQMPLKEGVIDIREVHDILATLKFNERVHVVFEYLTPLHQASKSANWSLALQAGAIEALCIALDLKYTKVPAKEWQKEMFAGLPPIRKKNGNNDTKALAFVAAKRLFPNVKLLKTKDGITDALLIAEWARRNLK